MLGWGIPGFGADLRDTSLVNVLSYISSNPHSEWFIFFSLCSTCVVHYLEPMESRNKLEGERIGSRGGHWSQIQTKVERQPSLAPLYLLEAMAVVVMPRLGR